MSSIKIRAKQLDGVTLVRMLIAHPMHNGRTKDPTTGNPIPAHFIEQVKIEHDGRLVADCRLSAAVSRDPYLAVRFRGGKSGDRVKVSWIDNLGQSDAQDAVIP